jgi:hypothetical protein
MSVPTYRFVLCAWWVRYRKQRSFRNMSTFPWCAVLELKELLVVAQRLSYDR